MSWLAQEAAQRYYQLCNMRPLLSLATADGAIMSPDDDLTLLLSNNEEVSGNRGKFYDTHLPIKQKKYARSFQKNVNRIAL